MLVLQGRDRFHIDLRSVLRSRGTSPWEPGHTVQAGDGKISARDRYPAELESNEKFDTLIYSYDTVLVHIYDQPLMGMRQTLEGGAHISIASSGPGGKTVPTKKPRILAVLGVCWREVFAKEQSFQSVSCMLWAVFFPCI